MQSVAFVLPLLPGQAEASRIALASCWAGVRTTLQSDLATGAAELAFVAAQLPAADGAGA
jgi:hypothetical protein